MRRTGILHLQMNVNRIKKKRSATQNEIHAPTEGCETTQDFISASGTTSDFDFDLIDLCGETSEEFRMSRDNILMASLNEVSQQQIQLDEDIPDDVYWESILTAMQGCEDFHQTCELSDRSTWKRIETLAET